MSTFLTQIGEVVTQVFDWVGDAVEVIVGSPFLLATTGVLMAGATIGIIGRLLRRG